jgi:hypothetical protein
MEGGATSSPRPSSPPLSKAGAGGAAHRAVTEGAQVRRYVWQAASLEAAFRIAAVFGAPLEAVFQWTGDR